MGEIRLNSVLEEGEVHENQIGIDVLNLISTKMRLRACDPAYTEALGLLFFQFF